MRKFIIDRYNAEDVVEVDVQEIPNTPGLDPFFVDVYNTNGYHYFTPDDLYDSEEEALEVYLAEICEDQRRLDALEKKILNRLFPDQAVSYRN